MIIFVFYNHYMSPTANVVYFQADVTNTELETETHLFYLYSLLCPHGSKERFG